jgi:asparagine synthase (glutamine-hydrolysing)
MCGIVAMLSKSDPVKIESLLQATSALSHRGPDGQKHWIAPHRRVGLGHTRLRVIDLTSGDQPIANEDERLHVVVNGEFYDYKRIRSELERRGHALCTRSDSEIVLHLYEEIGTESLHYLRGEFAFALWDESNQVLFAARDRFGIKPLFYSIVDDTLYLASEIKALFAGGVPAAWDHDSYYQQLFLYLNQDRTLFRGVNQVPPGCYLLATAGHVQLVRYWDLNYKKVGSEATRPSDEEYIERLRDSLDEAVRIRLQADVPVASFLSGGVDSSAVLGMAARHSPMPIHAFTVAFDHDDYDEWKIARETAAHVGAELHRVSVTQTNLADHLADAVAQAETLGINWHGVARYLLCRAVHEAGYKVVLTGEGGDELFAGYMQARQDLSHTDEAPDRGYIERERGGSDEFGSLAFVERALGFTPAWMKKLAIGRAAFNLLLSPDFANAYADRDPFRIFLSQFNVRDRLARRQPIHQTLYLWARSILPNYTLYAERLEMAHAVESRVPLLDHQVFELASELPAQLLIRGAREKYALREAAKHVLTERVYERPKHPFFAPPVTLATGGRAQALMQDYLRGPELAAVRFFDQKAVVALLDRLPRLDQGRRIALDSILMIVLSTCVLQNRYQLG